MKYVQLYKNEIQSHPVGDYFNLSADDLHLVYSPLAETSFVARESDLEMLEQALTDKENGLLPADDMQETIRLLTDFSNTEPHKNVVRHPKGYTKLSILPNFICNFSCSYCYSAKGRSNREIEYKALETMLHYFIDPERVESRELSIFISGGGEPLLSWEKVLFILEYANRRASDKGFALEISLMTNGSKISSEIITELKKYRINTGVSFEILPEIQNTQRGRYELVANQIKNMVAHGLAPSVSSVITEDNVERMEEMVEEIIKNYSGVKHLNFDPAMDSVFFSSGEKLTSFYRKFTVHFFDAREICHKNGITLDCNIIRKFEGLFPRYCQGKLCLTPEGKISVCHSISSPNEQGYDAVIYGEVKDGEITFNENKFTSLINENLLPKCHSCIAKWHCGGGCFMYKQNYNQGQFEAVCRFTQNVIKELILKRLDRQYQEHFEVSLKDYIANALK
jgi:radical SAM protein with 4Fe4S-binding SPASM domain